LEELEEVWTLPFKSQELRDSPRLTQSITELRLSLDHETDTGEYVWTSIVFRDVDAFRFTGYSLCTPDQVDAYDRLVAVSGSRWLGQMSGKSRELTHYQIFFDEFGCYDIAASRFDIVDGSSLEASNDPG